MPKAKNIPHGPGADPRAERFGRILKRLRAAALMTGAELARAAKITPGAVGHYETGFRTPRTDALHRIACVLRVPYELLSWFAYTQRPPDHAVFDQVESLMQRQLNLHEQALQKQHSGG